MRKTLIILLLGALLLTSAILLAHGFDFDRDGKADYKYGYEEVSLKLTVIESGEYNDHVLATDLAGKNYILNLEMMNTGNIKFLSDDELSVVGYLMDMGFESIEGIIVTGLVKDGQEYKIGNSFGRFRMGGSGFGYCH